MVLPPRVTVRAHFVARELAAKNVAHRGLVPGEFAADLHDDVAFLEARVLGRRFRRDIANHGLTALLRNHDAEPAGRGRVRCPGEVEFLRVGLGRGRDGLVAESRPVVATGATSGAVRATVAASTSASSAAANLRVRVMVVGWGKDEGPMNEVVTARK